MIFGISGKLANKKCTFINQTFFVTDSIVQQQIIAANLKKETDEIAQLTQKYGRRGIVSTWTRDFEIPVTKESLNDEGADFKELISDHSAFFGEQF